MLPRDSSDPSPGFYKNYKNWVDGFVTDFYFCLFDLSILGLGMFPKSIVPHFLVPFWLNRNKVWH
jgi:hypothetical protein